MGRIHEAEMASYEKHRADLLRESHGHWVLIKGETVHGVFETEDEALGAGYRCLGDRQPFLVRRIERPEEEKVHDLPWYLTLRP